MAKQQQPKSKSQPSTATKMTKSFPITGDNVNSPGNKAKVKTLDSLKKAGWNADVNSVKRKPGTDSVSIGFYKKNGKSIPITPKKK